jgi:hypothetical protein
VRENVFNTPAFPAPEASPEDFAPATKVFVLAIIVFVLAINAFVPAINVPKQTTPPPPSGQYTPSIQLFISN